MVHALEKKQSVSLDSDEFKKAVEEAASHLVQEAASKAALEAALAAVDAMKGSSDAESIGKAIASEMIRANGGTEGKYYIAPEVLNRMNEAKDEMMALIEKAKSKYNKTKDPEDCPKYRVIAETFVGRNMIYPSLIEEHGKYTPKVLGWTGVPNSAMLPHNAIARQIYDKWKVSVNLGQDPCPKDEIWVNDQGVIRSGKAPDSYTPPQIDANDADLAYDNFSPRAPAVRRPIESDIGLAFIN